MMTSAPAFLTPEYAYLELRDLGLLSEVEGQVMCGMTPSQIGRAWWSHDDVSKRPLSFAAEYAARHILGKPE